MQLRLFETPPDDLLHFEKQARRRGFRCIAGVDEVGRGPLAGPVVAAAVILPDEADLPGLKDSKQLSPSVRETCCRDIMEQAVAVSIGTVEAGEIDRLNILQATFKAMIEAVHGLTVQPDFLLIDGPYRLGVDHAQLGVTRGDRLSLSIAAASVVAKVHRDRLMRDYHHLYPVYGFDRNKGYGTRAHLTALRRHGPCRLHRLSFRPCREGAEEASAK